MQSEPIVVELDTGRRVLVEATLRGEEQVSVGLPKFRGLADSITEIAKSIVTGIEAIRPDSAEIEFGVDATLESGELTALLVKGSGTANVKVTLRWEKTSP
jgi:Trypsin-co-occurring domain 1